MNHMREHHSVLASAEQRLLVAIATRLPRWLNSDHLTLVGLLSMPAAGAALACLGSARWAPAAATAALAANWFGDSLEGTLARVRHRQRPRYGYYVDHVIDLAGAAALFSGLGASGLMTPAIAVAVLAAYLLVSAETFLATHAVGVFRLSFAGVGPTELRLLLCVGAFHVARHPWVEVAGRTVRLLDAGGLLAVAGLVAAFAASAVRHTHALYLAEPLP